LSPRCCLSAGFIFVVEVAVIEVEVTMVVVPTDLPAGKAAVPEPGRFAVWLDRTPCLGIEVVNLIQDRSHP